MKQHTYERALRAIAAALLSSGLSPQEIREVMNSLATDAAFGERLVRLADAIVDSLAMPISDVQKQASTENSSLLQAEAVLRIFDGLNISNKRLIETLHRYVDQKKWTPDARSSRRRIVEGFLRVAPSQAANDALAELTRGVAKPDPYFDEIMKRGAKAG